MKTQNSSNYIPKPLKDIMIEQALEILNEFGGQISDECKNTVLNRIRGKFPRSNAQAIFIEALSLEAESVMPQN